MTSYIEEFDDIPGTRVFTAQRAKAGPILLLERPPRAS